jgi:hypothetical protein
MRHRRFWIPPLLSATAFSLAGCTVDVKPIPFGGNLAIYLFVLVAVASTLGTLVTNKSLAVGATALVALVLSGFTTLFSDKFFDKRSKLDLEYEASKFLALLFFAIAMIAGGVLAMILVGVDPNISVYGLVITSMVAILITIGAYGGLIKTPERSDFNDSLILIIGITFFAIWSGSLLSLGFLYGSKVASILVILGGVGSVCFLCYRAWSTEEMQPKVGIYTVAAILTYELWLFVKRAIAAWG